MLGARAKEDLGDVFHLRLVKIKQRWGGFRKVVQPDHIATANVIATIWLQRFGRVIVRQKHGGHKRGWQ